MKKRALSIVLSAAMAAGLAVTGAVPAMAEDGGEVTITTWNEVNQDDSLNM